MMRTMAGQRDANLRALSADLVGLLRRWHRDEVSRSTTLRQLADLIVTARQHFTTDDGDPDWRGRTWPYREFMASVYEESAIPLDAQATVQGSVRYHVGRIVRERASADELERAGLLTETPQDRINAARSEWLQVAKLLGPLPEGDAPARLLAALVRLEAIADDPDLPAELRRLTKAERTRVVHELGRGRERLAVLEQVLLSAR